tara:strand:+ start:153 stop:260 length:108 start_codon:yes stop_codon:yes gene_type:complete
MPKSKYYKTSKNNQKIKKKVKKKKPKPKTKRNMYA